MLLIKVLDIRLANSFKILVQSIFGMPLKLARLINIKTSVAIGGFLVRIMPALF
jgi:hypothetical protein